MKSKRKNINKKDWLITGGLVLLSIIPMLGGAFRLTQLTGGAEITVENARFFAAPLPVVAHIIASVLYSIVGAFQFAPSFRRRKRGWHKRLGKWMLVPSGLIVALSGLWMTLFYPWPEMDGELLFGMRLIVGVAMFSSIVLGVFAVRKRDFAGHGDWMIRAYALGMGAGTQALTHLPFFMLSGELNEFTRALAMGAGWIINIIIAEWIIRKRRDQRAYSRRTSTLPI